MNEISINCVQVNDTTVLLKIEAFFNYFAQLLHHNFLKIIQPTYTHNSYELQNLPNLFTSLTIIFFQPKNRTEIQYDFLSILF